MMTELTYPKSNNKQQEKIIALFQFIKELNQLKYKPILNIQDYPWYFSLSNLPNDPDNIRLFYRDRVEEDKSEINDESGDILLSIRKPEFQKCPSPDKIFYDWLLPGWDDFHKNASVRSYIKYESDKNRNKNKVEYFRDSKERIAAYNRWLQKRNEWAEKQKIAEQTNKLFTDLYRFYFELQRESETKEIIVANGILCDRNTSMIKHPVLTHRVSLDYDPDENIIYILDTNMPSELYSILFQSLEDINFNIINALNDELQKNDYHPLDRNDTPNFLKILIHQLSYDSVFSTNGIPRNWSERARLLLYWEPCYIVRNRIDGTVKAIQQIIENVQETGEIPAPIRDIVCGGTVEVPSDVKEETIDELLAATSGESQDIYLAKEANREQLEIAKRIEMYNAVVVQGPPGTGKTHTIANLIGHFLAQGKSILVTSHTKKALNVLKDKVPAELQNLCVSMLDESLIDMEKSVDGITAYMSKTTSFELKHEMDKLAAQRREIIKQLADIRRKIFSIINLECSCIVYNGEEFTPTKAAKFVINNAEDLSYIPGRVRLNYPLPLTFEQLLELYRSNGEISEKDEVELSIGLPDPKQLMAPAEFEHCWNNLQSAKMRLDKTAADNKWKIENILEERNVHIHLKSGSFTIIYPQYADIVALKEYVSSFDKIENWMKVAAVEGKTGGAFRQRWITLISEINKLCELSELVLSEQFGLDIKFSNIESISQLKKPFEAIKKIFTEKGKVSKLTLLMHKEYENALRSVTINGNMVQSAKDCDLVLHFIELTEMRNKCSAYWGELIGIHNTLQFFELDQRNPELVAKKWIPYINRYLKWYDTEYQELLSKLAAVGFPENIIFNINITDSDLVATDKILFSVENLIPKLCDACFEILTIEKHSNDINTLKDIVMSGQRGHSHVCVSLYEAISNGDIQKYADAYSELERIYSKYTILNKRKELLKILAPIAPDWADAIENRLGIHGMSTVPSNIEDAWKWKQLNAIVADITSQPYSELQAESLRLSKEYRRVTALFAEKSGWYHLLKKTESNIDMRQALQGWKLTVQRIGKGTGKRAPALKARAREYMAKCQHAVPCWIMPINRALEVLNPKQNRFDIVIIDEASQADISSLAILYMGKKLIIVGDDKQVSPMAIGIEVDKVTALQQIYIKDKIKIYDLFNEKTSIYDIAATTFQPLMLREHFRSVPEIIGFSNQLSYNNKIKALRDASSSNLLPAVVNFRVADGQRIGKSNPKEAQAIVALLRACLEQPEYSGKSFGIISLLGDEQAKVIQRLMEEKIPPKEMISRRILCGNAANFQGDERDVIFLSIVDSGDGTGPLRMLGFGPDEAYRKRYNVAASRARDQLWVVYSLDPFTELQPGDLRKKLIDYAINPQASEIAHKVIDNKAESPFESDIAKALYDRGYHIEQQRQVGSYRLDIVVICGNKAVAIECDGERWHSGEAKIREDMERQTILERLGWRFIRIRGSEYYRYPDETIDRVIKELDALGIKPEDNQDFQVEAHTRDTELLSRVKVRANAILRDESDEEPILDFNTIAAALNSSNEETCLDTYQQLETS